ncbi:MAG: outer membrane lipoprotein carrier protein LolA [Deltaproteobacteria bacterium]|nr:outer membrane lipoprotein carrier protein LolA [Deltaproteobacteria bacterium]
MNFAKRFFIILFLLPGPLCALTPTEEVIQKVQATYEKAQDVSSQFVQKVKIASLEKEVEKIGKALFKKPGMFKVDYGDDSEGRVYLSNGKKLWVYDKGDTQVQVYPVSSKTIPEEALSFLGGLGNLRAQFKVNPLNEKELQATKANSQLDWLLLTPKNPESQLDELLLGFERKGYTVSEAYLKNETGNVSHYIFDQVKLNSDLKESDFSFAKTKGVKEVLH